MTKILEVRHLSKVVSERGSELVLLEDINFSLRAGEVAAIQGPSGAGKSTLLGLLAGLDLPTRGQVLLEGQDIFALDENARASLRGRLIGFVFQSFQLLPALTALENVMLPLELANRPQARLRARDILARVGLEHRLGHYPAQLSGGEQQRVAVARAFAIEPPLLLADEPTGNLDQQTGERVIELLFSLNAERQTTLVLVTHDAHLAARCERQLRIDNGHLLEPT
ncbi:ABC transporter ATP-binding protein [Thermithiobacillus plumbiphilus]|uniref:ATP-binding cassette domain-containing protein n=1 Tax=Thermithiobacillus plumbiphilus TaxID=1729899 RepID=A0ABU9D7G3_9PROT